MGIQDVNDMNRKVELLENINNFDQQLLNRDFQNEYQDPSREWEGNAWRKTGEFIYHRANEFTFGAVSEYVETNNRNPYSFEQFLRGAELSMYLLPAYRAEQALIEGGKQVARATVRVVTTPKVPGNTLNLNIKPSVSNPKLNNIINNLYKGQNNPNKIGNGTTMDAIRSELKTGQATGGTFHSTKDQESINGLNNLLKKGELSAEDTNVAKSLIQDLTNALGGK